MSVRSGFKKIFGESVNIKGWMGIENLKKDTKNVKNIVVNVLSTPKYKPRNETFEQCIQRLQLSEADLQKRMRTSLQLSLLILAIAIAVFAYGGYLWYIHLHKSTLLCVVLTLLLCSYAFREHFNYFQMKQRRLGCTLSDWLKYLLLGR